MKEKIWKALAIFSIAVFTPFAILFVTGSLVVRPVETVFYLAADVAVVAVIFKAARS